MKQHVLDYLGETVKSVPEKIAFSGLNLSEIARGTGCHWSTVYNAANGIPVRFDNARRLVYFLDKNNSK